MQDSISEILRLVADGVVGPEDGHKLLRALLAGYPEEFDRPAAENLSGSSPGIPSSEAAKDGSDNRNVPGAGLGSSDSDGSPVITDSWPGPAPRLSDAVSVPAASPHLRPGDAVEIPPAVLLRIDAGGEPRAAGTAMSSLAIRGVLGQLLRVVRGSGVELHRDDETIWRLTWPGGLLFLEIPALLAGLEICGVPGSVGLSGYVGPFSGEDIGGGFTVHGASAPFRIREVRGTVQLHRLALRDGISTIATVGQDVDIETTTEASVTIRASSRAETQDGASDLDARAEVDADRGGRRGVWRVGTGTAQLNVGQIRGRLRLHAAGSPPEEVP